VEVTPNVKLYNEVKFVSNISLNMQVMSNISVNVWLSLPATVLDTHSMKVMSNICL